MGFALIVGGMLVGNLVLWAWGWRRLRHRPRFRWLLTLVQAPLAGQLLWMIVWRDTAMRQHEWLPIPFIAVGYFWNLIVVPLSLLAIGAVAAGRWLARPWSGEQPTDPSRRTLLAAVAAFTPPAAAGVAVAAAFPDLNDFRLRRLRVPLPGLPERLDGATIAHVSDIHYGKFTEPDAIDRVIETVNGLDADLVLLTGDLIDLSLTDLDEALEVVRALRGRSGVFTCEGNHDLIDDGPAFRRRMREARVRLLRDEKARVDVRGAPVEILGVGWQRGERRRREATRAVARRASPEAFPILLSHHPHGFDAAEGVPLTLAGHTHGGLLMLNEKLGPGPVLYKYWSGLYRDRERALVVSNGVGSWFPVRTHAPAEIVHVTLERT